jgi:hypothetical protein
MGSSPGSHLEEFGKGKKNRNQNSRFQLRFEPGTYEIQADSLPLTGPFGMNM